MNKKSGHMSKKRILVTGVGSGFGEGAAIGLGPERARCYRGRSNLAAITSLRQKVKSLGLNNLRVEKLNLFRRPTTR
jgi:NAD(P)-dependent dehydrogenase (short-subunit alcohol dehydrogenase family)